jgi:AraC family transcriptional activator of mtrCDE
MRAGDFLLLARGQRHDVRICDDGTESVSRPEVAQRHSRAVDHATVAGAVPAIDLFCGHYSFQVGAGPLFLASIPDLLHVNLTASSKDETGHLVALLRSVVERDEVGASVMLDSLAQVLLILALQASSSNEAPSLLSFGDPAVRAVVEAVVARPGEKWTADRLSEISHVSRATLVRRFRRNA